MKKHIPLLAVCLFIYVFYRTENTLINKLIIALFSRENYLTAKASVNSLLPLDRCIVYSLPEGLWIFCITVSSRPFYLQLGPHRWNLVFAPILLALLMEFCQLLRLTNGRFDVIDLLFAAACWLLALNYTRGNTGQGSLFQSFNSKAAWCIASYSIVYLAHVCY